MLGIPPNDPALAPIPMERGLPLDEVERRLDLSLRQHGIGQRWLALALVEIEDKRLYLRPDYAGALRHAKDHHGLDAAEIRRLVGVGRKLLMFQAIDAAFVEDRISWEVLLLLLQIVSTEDQEVWIERAGRLTFGELAAAAR